MGFDVLSFVMGQQAGKASGGGSSNIILFEKQTVTGFETNVSYQGAFTTAIQPRPFAITVGEEYIVEWDGTEYKVTGQDTSSLLSGTVSIGNGTGFGFSGNNEPFFIIDWGSYMTFVAVDTKTSHTVKIYQETSSSGGGSSNSSFKSDYFDVTAGQMTIEHGGGAIPDLIIVAINGVPDNGNVFFSFGCSNAMLSKIGGGYVNEVSVISNSAAASIQSDSGIEGSGSDYYERYGGVRNVTATTFEIGNSKYTYGQLKSGSRYSWYAFYGLV